MEYNDSQYRAGGASRPPRPRGGEDTPLFTDEPYAPTRRPGGSGRPAEPFSSGRGGASADEILGLINKVRDTVYRDSGITLEPEVRLILNRDLDSFEY